MYVGGLGGGVVDGGGVCWWNLIVTQGGWDWEEKAHDGRNTTPPICL